MKRSRKNNPAVEAAKELKHLRAIARVAHRCSLARIEGEIARVLRCVAKGGGDSPRLRRDHLRWIVKKLKGFDIRAEKGRSKDLRRLDWLVIRLVSIVDEW